MKMFLASAVLFSCIVSCFSKDLHGFQAPGGNFPDPPGEGSTVFFERLPPDGGAERDRGFMKYFFKARVHELIPDVEQIDVDDAKHTFSTYLATGAHTQVLREGAWTDNISVFSGTIFPAYGTAKADPDLEFSCGKLGFVDQHEPHTFASSGMHHAGLGHGRFETSCNDPDSDPESTMIGKMVFLLVGSDISQLFQTKLQNQRVLSDVDDAISLYRGELTTEDDLPGGFPLIYEGFFPFSFVEHGFHQYVEIGETRLSIYHMGDGVFMQEGVISTVQNVNGEKQTVLQGYFAPLYDGYNRTIPCAQRIQINDEVIESCILQVASVYAEIIPLPVANSAPEGSTGPSGTGAGAGSGGEYVLGQRNLNWTVFTAADFHSYTEADD